MQNNPLVSCTVISYNSSKTIIETLESIKAQTYKNIELIISDDCSKDNTVELCQRWIEANKNRFYRTCLITSDTNTGVCANKNRATIKCEGVWLKGIAGDDILLPNCIENFIDFVIKNAEVLWVSSYMRIYLDSFVESNCIRKNVVDSLSFFDKGAKEQLNAIAKINLINAPSLFVKVSLAKEIGYNEEYSFEDWPFYVDVLEKGYKCFFMPIETVGYRIHNSASNSSGKLFNYQGQKEFRKFAKKRLFKYLSVGQIIGQRIIWGIIDLIEILGLNKRTHTMSLIYSKILAINSRL